MAASLYNCFGRTCETILNHTVQRKTRNGLKVGSTDIELELINEGKTSKMSAGKKKQSKLVGTGSLLSCDSCNMKISKKDSNENYLRNVLKMKGYALGKELGRGSFAVVRKARSVESKTKYAVKIVDCSKAPDDFVTHFFPRELAVIRKLQHINVVEVIDIVKVNWFTCIVMERASGGDILDYLVKHGPMDNETACKIFRQAMLGLQYCHGMSIAHRDLKCENVLLTDDCQVKIADFGFARSVMNKDKMRVLSETYCGSAAYAAPEVLQGRPYNPIMSDIWSMGIVLYIMVCAVMPFNDSSHRRMLADQRNRRWSFSPDRRAHITPNCRRLVRHLLEPDLTQRATMRMTLASPWLRHDNDENLVEDLAGKAQNALSES